MGDDLRHGLSADPQPDHRAGEGGGFDAYYVDHTAGIWPQAAAGLPFSAVEFQSKGDAVTDLTEDLAAEQKARTVYDNLLRMIDEPEVREPLKFLRAREIVHFSGSERLWKKRRNGWMRRIFTISIPSRQEAGENLLRKNIMISIL